MNILSNESPMNMITTKTDQFVTSLPEQDSIPKQISLDKEQYARLHGSPEIIEHMIKLHTENKDYRKEREMESNKCSKAALNPLK